MLFELVLGSMVSVRVAFRARLGLKLDINFTLMLGLWLGLG
jgi:hypothetical protein